MDQLIAALISAAIVIIGAIATFVASHLTRKSVKNNNSELVDKLKEIDSKVNKITENHSRIEQKLNKIEIKTEKRMNNIEKDILELKIKNLEKEQNHEQRL